MFSRVYQSATHESGRVGGDFPDIFKVRDRLAGITLGDVSGKGIEAAVTTAMISNTLRAIRRNRHEPTAELSDVIMENVMTFSEGVLRDEAAILVVELEDGGWVRTEQTETS